MLDPNVYKILEIISQSAGFQSGEMLMKSVKEQTVQNNSVEMTRVMPDFNASANSNELDSKTILAMYCAENRNDMVVPATQATEVKATPVMTVYQKVKDTLVKMSSLTTFITGANTVVEPKIIKMVPDRIKANDQPAIEAEKVYNDPKVVSMHRYRQKHTAA